MELNQPLDKILGPLIQWLRLIAVTMETSSGVISCWLDDQDVVKGQPNSVKTGTDHWPLVSVAFIVLYLARLLFHFLNNQFIYFLLATSGHSCYDFLNPYLNFRVTKGLFWGQIAVGAGPLLNGWAKNMQKQIQQWYGINETIIKNTLTVRFEFI